MNRNLRNIFVILGAVIVVFLIVNWVVLPRADVVPLDYNAFNQKLQANQVQTFDAVGTDVTGALTNGTHYSTSLPNRDSAFVDRVTRHVKGSVKFEAATSNNVLNWGLTFLPIVVVIFLVFLILRQAQSGGNQALSFVRSRAKTRSETVLSWAVSPTAVNSSKNFTKISVTTEPGRATKATALISAAISP